MSLIHWQPMHELDTLRQQMNRLMNEWSVERREPSLWPLSETFGWAPAIELEETDTAIVLKAQVPGVAAKDLDVQVSQDTVMISGDHQQEMKSTEKGFFRSEFRYGRFERTVSLPCAIQNDAVTSSFKDGVLTLTLPKTQEDKRKVVKVDVTNS